MKVCDSIIYIPIALHISSTSVCLKEITASDGEEVASTAVWLQLNNNYIGDDSDYATD